MGKYMSWEVIADSEPKKSNKNSSASSKSDTDISTTEQDKKSINHKLVWSLKAEAIKGAEALDGCYIISSDVQKEEMTATEIVASYKRLELVENAFRNLKTVSLEVRPVYHKRDDRIKAHVFLCMLSYYVQWHMQQRLQPLFDADGKGKDRRWHFAGIIETLKQVTKNKLKFQGVEFDQTSQLTKNQDKIIKYLKIKI